MADPQVVIVGGGLAGLAAAWALARRQVSACLLEGRRRVGGRAGSFFDTASGTEVDYCQHVAMGCCTNFLWWMQQCELQDQFSRHETLRFFDPQGRSADLSPNFRWPAPLHFAAAVGKLSFLTRRQQREIRYAMWQLMRTPADPDQQPSMQQWLVGQRQSPETIKKFWDVVLVSALGELTSRVGYAAARKVFIDGFLAAHHAADVWIPRTPLADLFGDRLANLLRSLGVQLRTSTNARSVHFSHARLQGVCVDNGVLAAEHVILAVPWHGLGRLVQGTDAEAAIPRLREITTMPASPISGIHLWFDRPITDRSHSVLVGGLAQWLFRPDPSQTVASRTENRVQPQRHASRIPKSEREHGADPQHYFQVVVSASHDLRGRKAEDVIAEILAELRIHFPAANEARLLRSRIVTDPNSVFSVQPACEAIRPSAQTDLPQLHLAGDYTATGWPATMEGAVISGFIAADRVLRAMGGEAFNLQPPLPRGGLARWLIRERR